MILMDNDTILRDQYRDYHALIMIINGNSQIILPIKSTYVRPSLFFNENEYC